MLVVLAAGILMAVPGLSNVSHRLGEIDGRWIVLAIALELLSCLGYVLAFQLVFHRAPLRFAARVAWSQLAFGAVVPAGGAGGAAVGAWIFHAKGFALTRVAERTAVLFLLTSAVNVTVLGLTGLAALTGVVPAPGGLWLSLVPAALGLGAIAGFVVLARRHPSPGRATADRGAARALTAGLLGLARSVRVAERLDDAAQPGPAGRLRLSRLRHRAAVGRLPRGRLLAADRGADPGLPDRLPEHPDADPGRRSASWTAG